ncbi:MAG: aldo/keto reductase [Gammaproteobacteria bacterium]|nr:MAG: aldo/keto reductase [Gammaproteobacteria bacterium]
MISRPIPTSDEQIPVIGLGTYSVFDVESTADEIAARKSIVDMLVAEGGSVIDTSPMYRRSEKVVGDIVKASNNRDALFLATKVWIDGREAGIAQMQQSANLMQTEVIDLMQVHNLRDTDVHMRTIRDWQEQGRIRYSGLTHYRADALSSLEAAMKKTQPDFIQINYSLGEREADQRLLPLAADMGIAVIINRPYQSGALFGAVRGHDLPEWAASFADSWGQFFLKYIISHRAVTCVIPATSKAHHMRDNLAAGFGKLPDSATRNRMVEFTANL